jgi:pilus assembly protein CpaF
MSGFGRRTAPPAPEVSSPAQEKTTQEKTAQEGVIAFVPPGAVPPEAASKTPAESPAQPPTARRPRGFGAAQDLVTRKLYDRIDLDAALRLSRPELQAQIEVLVAEIAAEASLRFNESEQKALAANIANDMLGLGPIEALLADDSVTDILVNGPDQIYVERRGKLEVTDIVFRDGAHVLRVAQRIARAIGRRIDETSPLVDARLADGSRVNIIIPPLAIDGAAISIRKFARRSIGLDDMVSQGNLSANMARVLQIAAAARLNVLISGGTGSGKTTLLNALSRLIDPGERIVTIEDAAEIQLQQPHVVRLETRPANIEGRGEISIRALLKNALRMRPDRIIVGECRGEEALDMLQAMNTGHDGSMSTLHANRPRDALMRLENMVGMSGVPLPSHAIRQQIVGAVDMIVQTERMRDGLRRVTSITEVIGMEGEVITTQDLFTYDYEGEGRDGRLIGQFRSTGVRPKFLTRAGYYGLDRALLAAMA